MTDTTAPVSPGFNASARLAAARLADGETTQQDSSAGPEQPSQHVNARISPFNEYPDGPTAIATRPDIADALERLNEAGLGGMNLIDVNDVDEHLGSSTPLLKIQQRDQIDPDHPDGAPLLKSGMLTHSITGEQAKSLQLTLIGTKFSRQRLAPIEDDGKLRIICAASTGRVADLDEERSSSPSSMQPAGTSCATCKQCKWVDGQPPTCSEVYTTLVFVHEWLEPLAMLIRKTGIPPFRTGRQQVKAAGIRAAAKSQTPIPPNLLIQFEASTEYVHKTFDYFIPKFSAFGIIADADILAQVVQTAGALGRQFAELRTEDLDEDGGDVGPGEGGGGTGSSTGHPDMDPAQFNSDDQSIPF